MKVTIFEFDSFCDKVEDIFGGIVEQIRECLFLVEKNPKFVTGVEDAMNQEQ